jgi:rare lipoprotein A
MKRLLVFCMVSLSLIAGCALLPRTSGDDSASPPERPWHSIRGDLAEGNATWYSTESKRLSAAHADLPLGTRVRVTNLQNNRQVIVTVTDRLLPGTDRIIDVAQEAAKNIRMNPEGTTPVQLEILGGRRAPPPESPE